VALKRTQLEERYELRQVLVKQPRHRFLNMLEYAEALQKALRNEPLDWFDRSKVKSRLERKR